MLSIDFLKKRYYDTRVGVTVFSPIIALVNFIILAYNFSSMKNIMNVWIFGVLVTVGLLVILTITGVLFRTKQYKVDLAYAYIENKEQLKTDLIILDSLQRFYLPDDPKAIRIKERMDMLRAHLDTEI